MSNVFDDFEAAEPPDDSQLVGVAQLAQALVLQQQVVADAEAALKAAKERLRQLEEGDLPQALTHVGIPGFDLVGGGYVRLCTDIHVSMSKKDGKNKATQLAYIRQQGSGALIKKSITVAFPQDGTNQAARLIEFIKTEMADAKAKVTESETVAPQTLKKFARLEYEAGRLGDGSPGQLALGAFVRRYAAVELPDGSATGGGRTKGKGATTQDDDETENEE